MPTAKPCLDLPPPPWIVGHRGAGGEAPENTLESLRLAAAQGADLVEVDLQLSKDGFLTAFHDWDLERLTGTTGVVEELTRGALRRIPLSRHPSGENCPTRIADLEEVLVSLPAKLPLNLELKRRRADPEAMVHALGQALADREQLLVSSFDWPLLAEVKRRLPHLPLAPLAKRGPRALLEAAEELGAFSVHCHRRLGRRPLIRRAEEAGRPTLVYTVNRAEEASRLLGRGAAGLFTDFPGRLRRELEARA
ncbi:MAG: glycerophosphodiester phosphodiesterase family protein [Thermoanaerobaculia bacterium]